MGAIAQAGRGIFAAIRSRFAIAAGVALSVALFELIAPVAVLSIARRPADFFTFNPWLRRLPDFLASHEPLRAKLSLLANLQLAWFSGGDEWSVIFDVPTLAGIACTALVFGTWFALWSYRRQASRRAGVVGLVMSVLGFSACPCTFAGASAATLAVLAAASRIGIAAVVAAMAVGIAWFGFRAGSPAPDRAPPAGTAPRP